MDYLFVSLTIDFITWVFHVCASGNINLTDGNCVLLDSTSCPLKVDLLLSVAWPGQRPEAGYLRLPLFVSHYLLNQFDFTSAMEIQN